MRCVILKYIKDGNIHYYEGDTVKILAVENGSEVEYIGIVTEILYSSFTLRFEDGSTIRFWTDEVSKIERWD